MLHSSVDTTEPKTPVPILLNLSLHYKNNLVQTSISAGVKKGKSEGSLVWVKESN